MKTSLLFRKAHKWLALIVGVQVLLWSVSGLYMTAVDISIIHGDHLVKTKSLPALSQNAIIPFSDMHIHSTDEKNNNISSVMLSQTPLGPEYWISTESGLSRVDAQTGQVLPEFDVEKIRILANYYYAGDANIRSIELLEKYPRELGGRPRPIWQVKYDDWLASTLYFLPETGALRSKRSDLWRWFDFLWMLHIMDYETREEVNNNLLRLASILGVLMVLAGLILLLTRLKAGYKSGKSLRSKIQMAHKVVITIVGIQVVIWMVSGTIFSILPQQKVSGWYLIEKPQVEYLQVNRTHFAKIIQQYPDAIKVEMKSILGKSFYEVTSVKERILIEANSLSPTSLAESEVKRIVESSFKGSAKFESIVLETEKSFENRKFQLPVWRANFIGDENPAVYVSTSGQLLGAKTDTWRLFDFFWMLHIMDYSERNDFNHWLIIGAAIFKFMVVLSGIWLLILVFKKTRRKSA